MKRVDGLWLKLSHSLSFVLLIVHLCWIFLLFGLILSLYQVNMRSMRTLLISCAHYYSRVIFISIYSIFVCFFCLDDNVPRSTQKTSYGITNGNRPIKKKRDSLKSRSCWCFFFSIHHNALPFFLEDFCFSCYESNRKGKNCGRSRNSAIKNSNSTEKTHWLLSFDTNRSIIDYWQGTIQKFPLVIKTNRGPSSITTFWVSSGNFGFRNFFMNRVKAEFNWDKKFNCNLLIKRKTFWEVTCTKSTALWSWILVA